jgi:hypothetical protein
MEWIHIMGEEAGAAELRRRPAFKEAVLEIVDGKRESVMKPDSARRFRTVLDKMKIRNETSVSSRLMPFLVKDGRVVSGEQSGERRPFQDDFLDWNNDADFRTASVPIPADKRHEKDVDKAFGVKNPRPDVVFGFDLDAFSQDELQLFNRFDPELSKGIVSPFFAVQWKGSKGTVNDAKIQVRRDGVAMVCARRKAQSTVAAFHLTPKTNSNRDAIKEDLDLDTIAFSAAITPDLAFIYVHWAQDTGDKVIWHMAVIKKFFMDDDEVPKIRAVMRNIIDWNLDSRMAALRRELKVYKLINEREAEGAREQVRENEMFTSKRRRVD